MQYYLVLDKVLPNAAWYMILGITSIRLPYSTVRAQLEAYLQR